MAQFVIIRGTPSCKMNYQADANRDNKVRTYGGDMIMPSQGEQSREIKFHCENKQNNFASGLISPRFPMERSRTINSGHHNLNLNLNLPPNFNTPNLSFGPNPHKLSSAAIFPTDESSDRKQVILLLPCNRTQIAADNECDIQHQINWLDRHSERVPENDLNKKSFVNRYEHANKLLWVDYRNNSNANGNALLHSFDHQIIGLAPANGGDRSCSIYSNGALSPNHSPNFFVQMLSNGTSSLCHANANSGIANYNYSADKLTFELGDMYNETSTKPVCSRSDEWNFPLSVLSPLSSVVSAPSQMSVADQKSKLVPKIEPVLIMNRNEDGSLVPLRQAARKGRPSTAYVGPPSALSTGHRVIKRRCHISEKNFVCKVCGKRYKYETNLITHGKVHTEHALECQYCHKKFGRKTNYVEHLRIHTNERPYKCRYCDKSFKQNHGWRDHERTHTNERPHVCDVCGKGFAVGHNLTVHKRIHTGEKPYGCNHCQKRFRQKSAFNAHMKNIHNITSR